MGKGDDVTGPMNLGNADESTISQLAELVIELTNSRSEIVRNPLPQNDPRQPKPDATPSETVLGWRADAAWRGIEEHHRVL